MIKRTCFCCAFLLAISLAGYPLGGDPLADEIIFSASESGLPVEMRGRFHLKGQTPFSISATDHPFMIIEAGEQGFEYRRARLSWDRNGQPVIINLNRRYALVGTLLPGMGSFLSGRRTHGLLEFTAMNYLVGNFFTARIDADDVAKDFDNLQVLFDGEADPEERTRLRRELDFTYARWQKRDEHANVQLAVTGIYAGLLVMEGWWLNQELTAAIRPGRVHLRVPRLSRSKALLASVLFPGMGQAYRKQKRSLFYTATEIFLIQEIMDTWARRQEYDSYYSLMKKGYEADGLSPSEKNELQGLWDRQQRATEDLQLFVGLAGAIWFINIVDSMISHPTTVNSYPAGNISLINSPRGSLALAWTRSF